MIHVKVIGIGGTGGCLMSTNLLPRYLAFQREEQFDITLIDGDRFEARNLARQAFQEQGNKAEVKARELRREFPQLTIWAVPAYVTPKNVAQIVEEGDIVLLAVDNHKTRLLVSQRCQELTDVTLISGGNFLVEGNAQVYTKRKGKNLTNPIETFHPEIRNPEDHNPGEDPDCLLQVAEGEPQLVITNMAAALSMACYLFQILEGEQPAEEVNFSIRTGEFLVQRRRLVDETAGS